MVLVFTEQSLIEIHGKLIFTLEYLHKKSCLIQYALDCHAAFHHVTVRDLFKHNQQHVGSPETQPAAYSHWLVAIGTAAVYDPR